VVTAVVGGGRDPAGQVRLIPWGDPRPAVTAGGPWPGHLPLPAPALVYPEPLPAVVRDREGRVVAVSGRGMLDEMPATLAIGRAAPVPVTAWAGPWPAEERWWDAPRRRRRARFQVGLTDGSAHVVVLENGRWGVEATYD
jgi:protein ImuB